MRLLPLTVIAIILLIAADAAAESDGDLPEDAAYTLDDEWDETWLRLFDRVGRPDPDGPMLQRFDDVLYRRYHFDVTVPEFPMGTEARWANQRNGARMWVQSLSELQLANRVQLRGELPTWEDGFIWLQYDRRQDRITDRHRFRFDIGHRDVADTGVDAAIRFHPGWTKNDVDVEALARYRVDGVGSAGLSVGVLDAFINASFGLLEARGIELEEHVRHEDLPLAVRADVKTASFGGVRGELYGGAVIPHERRHRFPRDSERDHLRERRALLGAALVEWDVPQIPVRTGAAVRAVDAEMGWDFVEAPDRDRSVRETTVAGRWYAAAEPIDELRLESSVVRAARPEQWSGPGVDDSRRDDVEWLMWLRGFWMPTEVVGADVQLLHMRRDTAGPPELNIDGRFHRLVTRVMLQLGDRVWTSFGVGWTLDPQTAVYDGGGMTLVYRP